jgi:putative DNA primase/helicase
MHRRRWLTEYLQSRRPAELVRHVPRVGWHGRCYVLPDETLGEPAGDPVIFHSEAGTEVNFAQRGTLLKWQANIARLCVGNSRMAFAVSTAFAGPLLPWSPIKGGGGLHYVGNTSTGKTTGLLAAASVWGKGTENDPGSYMQKWRATSNGLEYQAEQHNDCTLILDELGNIEAQEAGSAAYMLADGMGKTRGKAQGGLRHKPTWRLLFLSSGELSLAHHMEAAGKKMKGGQEVRLIPIPAEVQPGTCLETAHEFETGHELSEWVKGQAAKCYGTAGRAWLLWLVDNLRELPALIRERMAEFDRLYVRDDMAGQVRRGARRFALVAAAGEIASREAKLTGWHEGEAMRSAGALFNAWIATRPGGIGASEEATMLRDMRMHFLTCGEMNYPRSGSYPAAGSPCGGLGGPMAGAMRSLM